MILSVGLGVGMITLAAPSGPASAEGASTAWDGTSFDVDPAGVLARSDVVLGSAPVKDSQSMPLGNGTLGAAVWAEDGFTAQLNRADTLPDRKSPGQLVLPGLEAMTEAADYSGRLSLYDGVLTQSGGGLTVDTYVRADADEFVVDVSGADPDEPQTARLKLWSGRSPEARVDGTTAMLAETWTDDRGEGSTGDPYGSLAAVTAAGRDVTATVDDDRTVEVSVTPDKKGRFRIVVAAPSFTGEMDAAETAASVLDAPFSSHTAGVPDEHTGWWHDFWAQTGLIRLDSDDGEARYIESVRAMALYAQAAEERGSLPGTQAGVADLFAYAEDEHKWDASAYWHWNIRAQVAAARGAGAFSLNDPYFALYRENLPAIREWTRTHMDGADGICIPETMRFSGQGYENETWLDSAELNCDASDGGYYNKRTLTTGAEVGLNVWNRYLVTGDRDFLDENYPLMEQAARFLLDYATTDEDGNLHTYPSNAHESRWDVHDPTTDIAAMKALFPAVISAAEELDRDPDLVETLEDSIDRIVPWKTTGDEGETVIADSYDLDADVMNSENLGLEPVWPYGLIGDESGEATDLATRTYAERPNVFMNDWSFDAIQAARLGLRDQTREALVEMTKKYQVLPSGLGNLYGDTTTDPQPYVEQAAAVAAGVQESLAQNYDGLLRIAPALPEGWSGTGTVFVPGGKVDVQATGGDVTTAVFEADRDSSLTVRNPWPGTEAHIVAVGADGSSEAVAPTTKDRMPLTASAGVSYVIERTDVPTSSMTHRQVGGEHATQAKTLGKQTIGLDGPAEPYDSLADAAGNIGITDDDHTDAGNLDGGGASLSQQALADEGAEPGGTIDADGLSLTWPDAESDAPDNVISAGQRIRVDGSGDRIGFLVTGTYADPDEVSGEGTVTYADGSEEDFTLHAPDWSADPPDDMEPLLSPAYENRPGNTRYDHPAHIYLETVDLDPEKDVALVTLPDVSDAEASRAPMLHVFAMAVGDSDGSGDDGSGDDGSGDDGTGGPGSGDDDSDAGDSGDGSAAPGAGTGQGQEPGGTGGSDSGSADRAGGAADGTSDTSADAADGELPWTGVSVTAPAVASVIALLMGVGMVICARERRRRG